MKKLTSAKKPAAKAPATAKPPAAEAAPAPVGHIQITRDESRTEFQQMADASLSTLTRNASTGREWTQKLMGEVGINEAMTVYRERAAEVTAGELAAAKQMLMAQAMTLDAIFNDMASRAAFLVKKTDGGGWSFNAQTMESCTRIAFKAQGQCRNTLQTLGELVNPRSVAFIKQAPGSQANVTQGAQQVNNGGQAGQVPAQEDLETATNKLLEGNPSERLEFGAQGAAGGANQTVEAVGAIQRTEDGGGKVSRLPQRAQAR